MKNQELSVLYGMIHEQITAAEKRIMKAAYHDKEFSMKLGPSFTELEKALEYLIDFKDKCDTIEDIKEADFAQAKYNALRAHYYAKLEEAETIRIETARIVDDYSMAAKEIAEIEKQIKLSIDEMESKIIPKRSGALQEPGIFGNDIAWGREEQVKQFQKLPGDPGLSERLT